MAVMPSSEGDWFLASAANVDRIVGATVRCSHAIEQPGGLAQFPPHALQICKVETAHDDAERVIERFGDPDRLSSVRVSLVEHAAFGESAR
jgi:hypothetical protein